jgi:hypothetical protein
MHKTISLVLFMSATAHAEVTWVQETMPGSSIPTGRGYVTTPLAPGYTQVTPTQNGIVDPSRPGYVIGPTIGRGDPLSDPSLRARNYGSYDRYETTHDSGLSRGLDSLDLDPEPRPVRKSRVGLGLD